MKPSLRGAAGGDVDYGVHGLGYALQRQPDARIAAFIHAALGSAENVVNVGAGAGSYEPDDRRVVAVEPSATMRAQRPPSLSRAIAGVAEQLPFADDSFAAAMATVTVHQWSDLDNGLLEMRRVARGPVVILTFDPDALDAYWLAHYAPELIAVERARYPSMQRIRSILGSETIVEPVSIPIDCVDGFTEAFFARPERLLNPAVRQSQSAWSFVGAEVIARFVDALRTDLESGAWDARYGALRSQKSFEGSLRLVVHPGA